MPPALHGAAFLATPAVRRVPIRPVLIPRRAVDLSTVPTRQFGGVVAMAAGRTSSGGYDRGRRRRTGLFVPVPGIFEGGGGGRRGFREGGRRESGDGASSVRWQSRQEKDGYAREARVLGLKSRAAFKLLEIDAKYRIFKKGQTVVDLGYAPGSWCQVAVERTKPNGRIIGIDIIPAQPPKGVSTIQGNFLSIPVQEEVKKFLADPNRGRPHNKVIYSASDDAAGSDELHIASEEVSYVDSERCDGEADEAAAPAHPGDPAGRGDEAVAAPGWMVDVVLSDMSGPWEQTTGFWKKSLSQPYRMMNTSGINFADHAGSMDLCSAALSFAYDTLRPNGHFICKFYQGAEDKAFEKRLKKLFANVHREKPEASRSESKEAYFVALRRKPSVSRSHVVV